METKQDKMKQLELKYVVPYLPYELNMIFENKGGRIIILSGITDQGEHGITITSGHGSMWLHECGFKPILRPLSDLTKEIEINGIRFEPAYWFEICDDENDSLEFDFGNIKLIKQIKGIAQNECHHDLQFLPYFVINKFFEWHFDVFGLIEKGLAIDINTLNK